MLSETHLEIMQQRTELYFKQENCVIIGGKYNQLGKYSMFTYICQCGNIATNHPNGFRKGKRCGYCSRFVYQDDIEERLIRLSSLKDQFKLLSFIVYNCKCGHKICLPHVYSLEIDLLICYRCDTRHARKMPAYTRWKNACLSRDKECQFCCAKDNLCVHHIKSRQTYPELQYSVDNGIVMCTDCHNEFHHDYGQQTNDTDLARYSEYKLLSP